MPFGLIFAAIVFVVLGTLYGVTALTDPTSVWTNLFGLVLVVLSWSLGMGLVRRNPWARWVGVGTGLVLALRGLLGAINGGPAIDYVVFLASLTASLLLIVPASGDVRRGLAPDAPPRQAGFLGVTSLASFVLLVGLLGVSFASLALGGSLTPDFVRNSVSAKYGASMPWEDFGPGLEKARAEEQLIFVDFYAEWCGPCKMMDRTSFRDPKVIEALDGIIPVRVDSEETEERHGFVGEELAEEYGVMSYPTLMILDSRGKILDRRSSAQSSRQLISWFEEVHERYADAASAEAEKPYFVQ